MGGGTAFGRAWSPAVGAVLALVVLACTGASPRLRAEDVAAPAAAATAEEAVRQSVADDGGVYAGDCAAARSPDDLGKVCSRLIDERNGLRAYLAGRTFSEFSTWVFVEQTTGGWRVAGTAPLDFSATSIEIPWPR